VPHRDGGGGPAGGVAGVVAHVDEHLERQQHAAVCLAEVDTVNLADIDSNYSKITV
jgi:hypothetical protein